MLSYYVKIDYANIRFKYCMECNCEELCETCFSEVDTKCSMCVADEEIHQAEIKRSTILASKKAPTEKLISDLQDKVDSFTGINRSKTANNNYSDSPIILLDLTKNNEETLTSKKVHGIINLEQDEDYLNSIADNNDNYRIIIDDDNSPNDIVDISDNYNDFIDNIDKCDNNNRSSPPPKTFTQRINNLPDEVINHLVEYVPNPIRVVSEPITSRPGDEDFNPIIVSIGDKTTSNGAAFLTYRDSLRLSSEPSLANNEKYLNDSVLFFLTTVNFMKLSKKYIDLITYTVPHFYQVIGYKSASMVSNDAKYDMLTKGKTNKDFQTFFKTIAVCFFVFLGTHISFCAILFLKSLFYVDYLEAEVCSYNLRKTMI